MTAADNVIPLYRRHHGKAPYRMAASGELLGNLASFLPGYALHLKAKGQATKTIEKKILAVDQLAEFLGDPDVSVVTRQDIERFMAERLAVSKRSSAATTFNALRSFFGPLKSDTPYLVVDLGSYDSPMAGMRAPAYEEPVVEVVPDEILAGALASAEKRGQRDWEDIRDAALLRAFIDTGCRLSEITGMKIGDVLPLDDGRVLLRVWGKGRGGGPRERHVPIGQKTAVALRRYLRIRGNHPHAGAAELWLGRRGPLKPQGMRRMLERRTAAAGQRVNPHRLRHTWAAAMKADERNRDSDVAHLGGWNDTRMLARYGKVATAKRAVDTYYAHGAPGDRL